MGAKQSSEGGARAASSVDPPRASYYELLSVERTATEDEIKKAYRRKALELHPDRNFGREEEATKLFAEIQAAYEVLSDAQERAWYDSHENAILSGADTEDIYEHNVRVTTAEDITLMLSRFHGKVDYSDAATGFFGFLRETFEQLAKEENLAADWDGLEPRDYPSFGHKDDDYEDVVRPFYNVWSGFSTQKSFAWKDKFKLSEAPDRRYRRAMEKENKKFRDDAIKEFNSAVQVLVAFVRKRDPRYLPNSQTDDDRQKALRDASKDQAARARAANAAKIATQAVPQWAHTKEQSHPEQSDEWDEDEAQEEFECVACNKIFKSERQFEAHEKSKKHQKAVQAVRRQMEKDNKKLGLNAKKNLEDSEYSLLSDEGDMSDGEDLGDVDLSEVTQSFDAVDIKSATDSPSEADPDEQEHVAEDKNPAPEAPAVTKEDDSDGGTENEEVDEDSDANAGEVPKAPAPPPASAEEPQSEDEGPKKLGKAAQKRAKKAAKQAAIDEEVLKHKCAQCGAAFPSRTRLFQHITDFGHAAPVAKTKAQKSKGKK